MSTTIPTQASMFPADATLAADDTIPAGASEATCDFDEWANEQGYSAADYVRLRAAVVRFLWREVAWRWQEAKNAQEYAKVIDRYAAQIRSFFDPHNVSPPMPTDHKRYLGAVVDLISLAEDDYASVADSLPAPPKRPAPSLPAARRGCRGRHTA